MLLTIPWFKPDAIRIPVPDAVPLLPDELPLHPFGMLVAAAVLVGARVCDWKARREGLHPKAVGEFVGYMFVSAFVLSHVLDAVFYHWDEVERNPLFVLQLWNGLSSFGGFIGAVVGSVIWSVRRRVSLLAVGDCAAFAFPFGWIFGRLGCFVAHDHPGAVTDFFLAVEQYEVGLLPRETRHDLGFYEVLWCAAVIPLFAWLARDRRRPRGFYLALLPILYAPVRFGLDFLRATDAEGGDARYFGLTPGHYGALLLFAAGLAVWWRVRRGPEPTIPAEAYWQPELRADAARHVERTSDGGSYRDLDGARAIEAPLERHRRTARWPGDLVTVELRGRELADIDQDELAIDLRALEPIAARVWIVDASQLAGNGALEQAAALLSRAMSPQRAPFEAVTIVGGRSTAARALAEAAALPVWSSDEGALPFRLVAHDGTHAFTMRGELAAEPEAPREPSAQASPDGAPATSR